MPVPKGQTAPPIRGKTILFDLDAPDDDVFSEFSEKLQRQIETTPEWMGRDPF
jgi:hypothetical protein